MAQHDDDEEQHLAHDESNWLVSYADMMTLLFGFFVLMYSMSRVDNDKFQVVSKDIAQYFGGKVKEDSGVTVTAADVKKHLGVIMKEMQEAQLSKKNKGLVIGGMNDVQVTEGNAVISGKGAGDVDGDGGAASADSEGISGIKAPGGGIEGQTGEEGSVSVETGATSMTLKFSGAILFSPASAQIRPEFAKLLNEMSQRLKASQRVKEIRVEGHTDDSPIKSMVFPTNWELSAARAARVVRQITANGFKESMLVAQGFGSAKPEAPNRDAAGKGIAANMAKNRRVVVHVEFTRPQDAAPLTAENYFEKVRRAQGLKGASVADTGSLGDASEGDDVESRIQQAKQRLEDANRKVKEQAEAAKKQKKLEELEKKLEDLKKKTTETESKLQK